MTRAQPTVRLAALLALLSLFAPAPVAAQHTEAQLGAPAESDSSGTRLYDRAQLGGFTRTVTTGTPQAQAFFNQGIVLMYAFDLPAARASFQRAQALDSTCATTCRRTPGTGWAAGATR